MAGLVRSPAEQMEFDTLISSMWKSQAAGDEGSVFRGTPVEALRLLHTAQDFAYEGLSDDGGDRLDSSQVRQYGHLLRCQSMGC